MSGIETLATLVFIGLSAAVGLSLSRRQGPWWIVTFAAAITVLATVGVIRHWETLSLTPPFEWLAAGRRKYVGICFALPMLYTSLVTRIPVVRQRILKYGLLVDHWVAILQVQDRSVVIGDPLQGKRILSHAEFEAIWRFTGIVLERPRGPGKQE